MLTWPEGRFFINCFLIAGDRVNPCNRNCNMVTLDGIHFKVVTLHMSNEEKHSNRIKKAGVDCYVKASCCLCNRSDAAQSSVSKVEEEKPAKKRTKLERDCNRVRVAELRIEWVRQLQDILGGVCAHCGEDNRLMLVLAHKEHDNAKVDPRLPQIPQPWSESAIQESLLNGKHKTQHWMERVKKVYMWPKQNGASLHTKRTSATKLYNGCLFIKTSA